MSSWIGFLKVEIMNVCWYEDDEIAIKFNIIPDVDVRIIEPSMPKNLIEDINKKPFINNEELQVVIEDKIEQVFYGFTIKKGYIWDGASIPRMFWRLIGAPTDNKFLIPSLIHDILCENHDYIDDNRGLSTLVFDCLLKVSRVHPFNRWLIKHSVDNYQKFCGW